MEENDILSIKWKDFHENTKFGLGSLKENQDFTDVTLVSEDGLQVEAHKVILAASSPFFRDLLGRNARSDAFIYMRGATSTDMISIVDFLYYGEVQVHQDNLRSFLTMATELRLEGLFDDGDGAQAKTSKILSEGNITRIKTVTGYSGQSAQNKMEKANNSIKDEKTSENICVEGPKKEQSLKSKTEHQENIETPPDKNDDCTIDKKIHKHKVDLEMKRKLSESMKPSNETEKGPNPMKVDSNLFSCDLCEKKYKTYNHLNTHKNAKHEEKKYMCDECDYQSAWHSHFLRHKQSKHGFSQPRNGRLNYCD